MALSFLPVDQVQEVCVLDVLVELVQQQPVAEGGVERFQVVPQRVALHVALQVLHSDFFY